jgi:phage gp36-like protein
VSRYATPADLVRLALTANALSGISSDDQQAALDSASSKADSYLGAAFRLPLSAWGDDVKLAVCQIAAFSLLSRRGYNPQAAHDTTILTSHDTAIRWLEQVSRGHIKPSGVTDSAPSAVSVSRVSSKPQRGW